MRSLVSALLFTSASLTITASAFADDQTTTPVFALMDNTGDGSKLDLGLAAIPRSSAGASGALGGM